MANMSYCRWQNTNSDLMDCLNDLNCALEDGLTAQEYVAKLSIYERNAFNRLVEHAKLLSDLVTLEAEEEADELGRTINENL